MDEPIKPVKEVADSETKLMEAADIEIVNRSISKVNDLRHQFWNRHRVLKRDFLTRFPADDYSGSDKWKELFSLIIDMEESLLSEDIRRFANRRSMGSKYNSGLYPKEVNNPEQMLSETERKVHCALRSVRDPQTGCTHIELWQQEAGKQNISPRDFKKTMRSLLEKGHVETDQDKILYWSTLAAINTKLCEVCSLPLQGREIKYCSKDCKRVAESRRFRSKNPAAGNQSKLKYLKYILDYDE